MRHSSTSSLLRQSGGTLLGLIIGLIIGLGIAVVVALTINKTSLPFLNKQARPDRVESAEQATDPNKPLYGNKAPAREAAKDFAVAVEPVPPPPNAADPQAAKNAAAKEAAPTPPAEKLKKQDAAKSALTKAGAASATASSSTAASATSATAAPKPDADEKWTYFLQAGAFRDQTDAEGARAKLALLGFEARVTERPGENGILYRVRVGPFGQLETMNRMRSKLSDNGVDVAVIRTPKNP